MRTFFLAAILALSAPALAKNDSLLGQKMPVLPAQTLDGVTVDAAYFLGKVTLVNFMYIGCPPCMAEIAFLNRLYDEYRAGGQVQVLCIARQMPAQMRDFNTADSSLYGKLRQAFGAGRIRYPILPACPPGASTQEQRGDNIRLNSECNTVSG